VDECVETTRHTLERVRQLSLMLRPLQLDDLGLVAALRSHLDHQASIGALIPHFDAADAPLDASAEVETACFRVAQEAITNVLRHAGARNLWLRLFTAGDRLALELRDDGAGFDLEAARRGRREPRPGGHGRARGAGRRIPRAALGARTGHGIAGNIRAGLRRKGTRKLIRVVLADDHALVRAGIRSLLNAMHDVEVVGEAASGEEALEIASREQPDVVLMDIAMKGITGLEA